MPALTHAMLGVSVAALAAAAVRIASLLAPAGLERALAAAPLAVAAAVAEALLLGVAGLGGSSIALTVAALLTWGAIRALTPSPARSLTGEFASWWRDRPGPERALVGALGGAAVTWAAWQLLHPQVGFDSDVYHLPQIVLWVQGGHPGAVENVLPGLPVGNYPLTGEVTVAWAMGIARSFVPFLIWPWLALLLTASAGWAGLRALGVPPLARGLAVAALCSSPWLLAWQSHGTMTDPAALAWLVCGAALFALARERPALLGPAILALGLSIGVKTTTLPSALLVAAVGLASYRGRLRLARTPILVALGSAVVVGGVWYVRNMLDHGSPFWPIIAAPWGDPVPHWIELVRTSFLDRPAVTVDRLGNSYVDRFGGGLLLLAGGMLAPLVLLRRRVIAAGSVTGLLLLLWMLSPLTGVRALPGGEESVFSTTRYLLPALAVAALALALATRSRRRIATLPQAILLAATVVNLVQVFDLGFPSAPPIRFPIAGAAVGGLLGLLGARAPSLSRLPRLAAPLAAALLGALLVIPAHGFVARHGATQRLESLLIARVANDPAFRDGESPVATTDVSIGPLAGDRLGHRLELIPRHEPCARVATRARTQWLVIYSNPGPLDAAPPLAVRRCLPGVRPMLENRQYRVYRPLEASRPAPAVTFLEPGPPKTAATPPTDRTSR